MEPPAPDTAAAARLIASLRGSSAGGLRERLIAKEVLRRWPHFRALVRHADAFHARAALHAAQRGQDVVFAAAGRPYRLRHGDPPHLAALRACPDARFTYCDADPNITGVRQEVIRVRGEEGRVSAVACSAGCPEALIAACGSGPLQVQFILGGQWSPPGWSAELLGAYRALLPSGSTVALTLISAADGEDGEALLRLLGRAASPGRYRCPAWRYGPDDVAGWLAEAGLVLSGTGVTDVRARDQQWAESQLPPLAGGTILEAVAAVP